MAIQIITTPKGEELVIIPRAEYDALLAGAIDSAEDAADVALANERLADIAAGRDALLPAQISTLMLSGNSLLRALRKWRGVTQARLSTATGLAQGYISDLESGRKTGTAETMRTIAKGLDIDPVWLGVG